MAPSVKVQVTPSQALKPSVMICARRRRESMTEDSSALYCSYDSLPSWGGFTISAMPSCAGGMHLVSGQLQVCRAVRSKHQCDKRMPLELMTTQPEDG